MLVEAERFPRQVGRHRCLEGYVIVDLTQYLSGPFRTAILAALGATVLKVEPPETGGPCGRCCTRCRMPGTGR